MEINIKNRIIYNEIFLQLSSDTVKYIFSKIVPGLCGFFSIFIFMRMIGADQYGRYALAVTFVNMIGAFCSGWIRQSLLRYYTVYSTAAQNLKKAVMLAVVLVITVGLFFTFTLNIFIKNTYPAASVIPISMLFCVLVIYNIRIALFQSQLNPKRVMTFEFIRALLGLALPIILIYFIGKTFVAIIIGLVLAYALPLFCRQTWFLKKSSFYYNQINKMTPSTKKILGKFWHYGWPLSFWFSCVIMLQVTDRYLIKYFYNFATTGVYSSLYDVVIRSFSLLLFPITLAAHPRIMNLWNDGKNYEALSVLKWALLIELLLFVPIFLIYSFLSDTILKILLPKANSSYKALLPPLAIGGFLWQLALLVHKPLEILSKTKWMLFAVCIALLVNIAGNYFFLPVFGAIAAAYTTIAASLVYFMICFGMVLKFKGQFAIKFKAN